MSGRRVILAVALVLALGHATEARAQEYEVWSVDQANPANGGDILYIYSPASWTEPRERVFLWERSAGVGDGPGMRPHFLLFNGMHSHGLLANVASGHVYVIRASDRSIVASIDVGEQAHAAMASPDDRWILVANQNGKRLARIQADLQPSGSPMIRRLTSTSRRSKMMAIPTMPRSARSCTSAARGKPT